MTDEPTIDGDRLQADGRLSEPLMRRREASPPPPPERFQLTATSIVQKDKVEAQCAEMEPLIDLNLQLERLGYQFVRLERLDATERAA